MRSSEVRTRPAGERRAVQIHLAPAKWILSVKSWNPDHAHGASALTLANRTLPAHIGGTESFSVRAAVGRDARVLCLGPAEWLLISAFPLALNEIHPVSSELILTDLTHGWVTLELEGPSARDLLSKGTGLDVDIRAFPPGHCARTRLAQIRTVIHCVERHRFHLHVSRSYLSYLRAWLCDAGIEFGRPFNAAGSTG